MKSSTYEFPTVVTPTDEDALIAQASSQSLSSYVQRKDSQHTIKVIPDNGGESELITVPASAFRLFVDILAQMANGNSVTLTPIHGELTTQEAADVLNVSRPYLIKLLEEGQIPFRKVGTRRRVLCKDLIEYKRQIDEQRKETLYELAAQAQELNMEI